MEARSWEQRHEHQSGACELWRGGEKVQATWRWGVIKTGRTGTWTGYYVIISADEHHEAVGTHPHNLRDAIRNAVLVAADAGYSAAFVGLDPACKERGLTCNSGWGEIDRKRVHLFAPAPAPRTGE